MGTLPLVYFCVIYFRVIHHLLPLMTTFSHTGSQLSFSSGVVNDSITFLCALCPYFTLAFEVAPGIYSMQGSCDVLKLWQSTALNPQRHRYKSLPNASSNTALQCWLDGTEPTNLGDDASTDGIDSDQIANHERRLLSLGYDAVAARTAIFGDVASSLLATTESSSANRSLSASSSATSSYFAALLTDVCEDSESDKAAGNAAFGQGDWDGAEGHYRRSLARLEAALQRATDWLRFAGEREEASRNAAAATAATSITTEADNQGNAGANSREAEESSSGDPRESLHRAMGICQALAGVTATNMAMSIYHACHHHSSPVSSTTTTKKTYSSTQKALLLRRVVRMCDRALLFQSGEKSVKAMFRKAKALVELRLWEEAEGALKECQKRLGVEGSGGGVREELATLLVVVEGNLITQRNKEAKVGRGLFGDGAPP